MSKLRTLRAWFSDYQRVLVALSGGVDSALVAHAAHSESPGSVALTADYRALPREDLDAARRTCAEIGIRHVIIRYDELLKEPYAANGPDRCFHCRTELGTRLREAAVGTSSDVIVDGTHLSDMGDYRPGLDAMRAAGVRSPLVEAGLTKADVRECAREAGLSVHDRPANSCLSSRIPWGRRITAQRLTRIELAEKIVRNDSGIGTVRVRDMGKGSARIEVPPHDIVVLRQAMGSGISAKLHTIGYAKIVVDPRGYMQGGANAQEH